MRDVVLMVIAFSGGLAVPAVLVNVTDFAENVARSSQLPKRFGNSDKEASGYCFIVELI